MTIWLTEIWQAWRAMLRWPGFLLLASGVLALGVGASVAAFTLVDNLLLRPLPYPQPQQLVNIGPANGWYVSPKQYRRLQSLQHVASTGLLEAADKQVNVSTDGVPQLVSAMYMDRGLLRTVGLPASLGRNFTMEEDRPDGPPAVMLSHAFWQSRFRSDPHVIGQTLWVDGVARNIVGVLPAAFKLLGRGSIALPLALPIDSTSEDALYILVARLSDGLQKAAVAAQASARWQADEVAGHHWATGSSHLHFVAKDLKPVLLGKTLATLTLLQVSALLVLLVALVNLTNLLVLRALAHGQQVAVRIALGASAVRQVLPSLAEGLLVGLGGTVLGMALAQVGLRLLHFAQPGWMGSADLDPGTAVWAVALSVGMFSALLAGVLGWWRGRRANFLVALREGGRAGAGLHGGRLGRLLVVAQVALATVLVSAAVMFAHAVAKDASVPLGFGVDGVLTFELKPVDAIRTDAVAVHALSERVAARLRVIPDVSDATAATSLPAMARISQGILQPNGQSLMVQLRGVDAQYFRLFHIPLRTGRLFTDDDAYGAERVAVINESFARSEFHGHALGKLLGSGDSKAIVVGVVGDTRAFGVSSSRMMYEPIAQMVGSQEWNGMVASLPLGFAIRARGGFGHGAATLQDAVAEVAPGLAVANVRTMDQVIHDRTATERLNLWLISLLAALALLLAAVGVYAVIAVWVASCKQELGVRAAMGASPRRLAGFVFTHGGRQVVVGLLIGLCVALMVCAALRGLFLAFGRSAWDPWALMFACLLLVVVGSVACLLPALRAARVAPMRALRGE